MEAVRPMLKFRRLLSRDLINNPYIRKYYLTPEEINRKRNIPNDRPILIKLPSGNKFNGKQLVRQK